MGNIIRLDPVVASQIAAGEVVESPASVVKELVENSLDAGADRVVIEFEDSGLSLVRVSDNGTGMDRQDAENCLQRFTTSKLKDISELSTLTTLGFRGEALPSIASCSRITLKTKPASAPAGTILEAEAGEILSITEAGLPAGTSVTVRDLFFNTPARLKFVRSRTRERQAIIEMVERLAFSSPDKQFVLLSSGRTVLRTSGQGLRNAIADVYGPEASSSVTEVEFRSSPCAHGAIAVSGFVGMPSLYRNRRDRQIFSVNSRPVRNAMLGWALDDAFSGLLPPRTYPVAVMDLRISPGEIDVNVHPTKAEIRFRNERSVRSAFTGAVRAALNRAGLHVETAVGWPGTTERTGPYSQSLDREVDDMPMGKSLLPGAVVRDLGSVLSSGKPVSGDEGPKCPPGWAYLGSLLHTYLVAASPDSLLIVDKHAFMEAQVYQELLSGRSGRQELLMGEMITLDVRDADVYEHLRPSLEELGFSSRLVGQRTVMVTGVPLVLGQPVNPETLREIMAQIVDQAADGDPRTCLQRVSPERIMQSARIATAACHGSIRAKETLHEDEACKLLWGAYRDPALRTCPHGRPTVKEIRFDDIHKFFGRTSHDPNKKV